MFFAMGTGILMSFTILIVMARIGLRKFMGYPAILDGTVVFVLGALLHGTFGGVTAAISGGLFFSLMITVIRRLYGYERLTRQGWVVKSHGALFTNIEEGTNVCRIWKSKLLKPLPLCIVALLILLLLA